MPQTLEDEKDDRRFDDLAFKIYASSVVNYWNMGLLTNEEFVDKIIELKKKFKPTKEI